MIFAEKQKLRGYNMKYKDNELTIRPIIEEDLRAIWELAFKESSPEWKKWDAPYYEHKALTYEQFIHEKNYWINQDHRWVIVVEGNIIGTVNYYWEHKPSKWLEMGIVIYKSEFWNGGYGTRAFKMWIAHLFGTMPLVRVGFTTWSGNKRMMNLGEKMGMTLEARIRKVRFYNGNYYDSIRMGLLREEWEQNLNSSNRKRETV